MKQSREEKEIKKLLNAEGGNHFFDAWVNQQCPSFNNKTPRELIDAGKGQIILDQLYRVLKQKTIQPKSVKPTGIVVGDNKV